jgi:hypothetical protein
VDSHRFWSTASGFVLGMRIRILIHEGKKITNRRNFMILKCQMFSFGVQASLVAWTSFLEASVSDPYSFFTDPDPDPVDPDRGQYGS